MKGMNNKKNGIEDGSGNLKRKGRNRSKRTKEKENTRGFDTNTDHSVINHQSNGTNPNFVFDVSSDIQFKIFSCLPAKSLFKFKCVSKEIRRLIEDPLLALEHSRRLAANLIPSTGFFFRLSCATGYKPFFFKSTHPEVGGLPDASLSFLKEEDQLRNNKVKIIDSCNGFLLCEVKSKKGNNLYVCNPLTKQKVFVPAYPRNNRSVYRNKFALMAESTSTGYLHYKVICVRVNWVDTDYSKLWIFSSDSGEWEEFKYRFPFLSHMIKKKTKIFDKGTLFWDCFESGQYILVCYLNNKASSKCFDLIECPSRDYYLRFLWNHDGKVLLYSHAFESYKHDDGVFSAWSLYFNDVSNKIEWKVENSLQFRNLAEDIWKCCFKQYGELPPRIKQMPRPELEIVGYDPSLKTIYVSMDNALVSYDIVERRIELVCGTLSGSYYPIVVYPYVHNLEHIEIGRTQTATNTTSDYEPGYAFVDSDDKDDDPILAKDDVVPILMG